METPRFQLAHSDAVAWLRTLNAGSVDLVVTDPPYESLEKHRAIGTTTRLKHSKASSNDWFTIFPNARFPELFAEIYRVLKKDSHFYLYCDPETMFVAKPLAEAAGFKFWKPIIWDKCLGPDTLVWTERGTRRIADIVEGDRVALPDGGTTRVRATRKTRSPSVKLHFSDGTSVIASRDHRFQRADGSLVEAADMRIGDAVRTRPVRATSGLAKRLGIRAKRRFKVMQHLMGYFVGGRNAKPKFLQPILYAAPAPFRQAGLIEGGGHRAHAEQRETYITTSADLAMFARRELAVADRKPSVRRFENAKAGSWKLRFDRSDRAQPTTVTAVEDLGMQDLVDISIEHADELFLLANGVVTHNCKIGMGYHYRARYECILFFEKGKRKLNDLGIADILEAPRINGGYPAEKPPAISGTLITQSTEPGQLVIDPFMGSGSVGFAAVTNGRSFMGNDLCKEAVDITRSRLLETHAVEGNGREAAPDKDGEPPGPAKPQLGLSL